MELNVHPSINYLLNLKIKWNFLALLIHTMKLKENSVIACYYNSTEKNSIAVMKCIHIRQ